MSRHLKASPANQPAAYFKPRTWTNNSTRASIKVHLPFIWHALRRRRNSIIETQFAHRSNSPTALMSAQIAGPDNRSFVTALGTRVTGNRSRLNESRLIKHAGRIQRIRPTFLQNPPFRYLTSCTCVVTSEQCRAGGE